MLDVLCLAAHRLQLWADLPKVLAHHASGLCPTEGAALPLVVGYLMMSICGKYAVCVYIRSA